MKPELQRIATTLEHLAKYTPVTDAQGKKVSQPKDAPSKQSFSVRATPFTTDKNLGNIPSLPKLEYPQIQKNDHKAEPALAMNILHDIEKIVVGWEIALQKVQGKIKALYLEGPIIDGWLESHPKQAEEGVSPLRKAQGDHLMDYVEQIADTKISYQSPRSGYRLCGLDENGNLWSKHCPETQVPDVSLAIARYQKLRQLLLEKQSLEARLSQLSANLVILHGSLSE